MKKIRCYPNVAGAMAVSAAALLCCLSSSALAQFVDPQTPTNALPVSGGTAWGLVFSDEFNTNDLDTSKWGIDVSTSSRAARTDRGIDDWWWKSENVSCDGSNLVIDVVKHDANTMYCGSISSDGKFEPMYGYLEARVQIADSHKDTHTAFWTQGPNMSNSAPNNDTAADGAEIDIFESAWFGDYTKSVVHRDGYDADHEANTVQYSTPGLHSGYHVFGLEWTATSMRIYYDGVHKVTYTGTWVPQTNEWLWLSNGASFGDIGDFQTDPDGWLTYSKWDYVRVWQSASNAAPEFTTDPLVEFPAVEFVSYSGSISNTASDAEGDAITYSKVTGPSWLSVALDGELTGTPSNSDVGTNSWTVQAEDVNGNTGTATLEIVVNAAGASVALVGGALLNGNFNAVPGEAISFSGTPEWYNMEGNQGSVATRSDVDYDGTQNAVVQSGRLHGLDTGYAIAEGDSFDISYVWKDDWNWVDNTDQVTYSLFVTADDTITGTRTDLVVHQSGTRAVDDAYEAVAAGDIYTASASDSGKRLFIAIETISAGFARVDNVTLSVATSIPDALVTTNHSVPYAWLENQDPAWTNDFEAAATNDADGDGFTTAQEYWSGTDPRDAGSRLQITAVEIVDGDVRLVWSHEHVDAGIPPICVQKRASLSTGDWSYAGEKIPTNGINLWDGAAPGRFYFRLCVTNMP